MAIAEGDRPVVLVASDYYRAVWDRLPAWAQEATRRYMEANTKEARDPMSANHDFFAEGAGERYYPENERLNDQRERQGGRVIHPANVAYTQGVSGEQFDNLLYALRQAGYVLMRTDDLPPGWQDRYTPSYDAMQEKG